MRAARHLDAVDEQREEPELGEVAGAQLGELGGRPGNEAARDRRARGAAAADVADRLEAIRVAAAGEPGEHPRQRGLAERVTVGHGGVRGERELAIRAGAGPRPLDLDEPSPERHEARLGAVAVG